MRLGATERARGWATRRRTCGALPLLAALFVFFSWAGGLQVFASEAGTPHVVVLGDPHLPGKHLSAKTAVLETIDSWDDVDRVVAMGDICEDRGTVEEYAAAKKFFTTLTKPAHFLVGNHDYIYEDATNAKGGRIRGSPASRAAKLQRFKDTFGLDEVYSSRRVGDYLLLFLSTDHLLSSYLAEMSSRQLDWLRAELRSHKTTPTAIFFHAPLRGTLLNYNDHANTDSFVAQPVHELRELLSQNPQVFLWIAGHMHVPATNESYRSAVNVFEERVTTVHVSDMNRERIWSTSLFLFPDRVVVKTYDHKQRDWIESLERTVKPRRN